MNGLSPRTMMRNRISKLALADTRVGYDIAAPVESTLAAHRLLMKRFDLAVVSALALLGVFVTREALAIRAVSGAQRTASFGIARVDSAAPATDSISSLGRRPAPPITVPVAPPVPDLERLLERSRHDTYIADVLASHDSALARWPDRGGIPLRVWVQPTARHEGFNPASVPVVRQAFVEWANTGIPILFTFVTDSAMADVRVTWVDKFNESISGKTLWAHDDGWWIIDANIQLAVHHHSGEVLDTTSVRAIAMHEVGHLIGLDHTSDTTSIMAPKVRVRELSAADRATAQLLYSLPAGRVSDRIAQR
jgi:matrixin